MQKIGEALNLSAGDLVGHLNCRYLTELDLKVARGELQRPKIWDPTLQILSAAISTKKASLSTSRMEESRLRPWKGSGSMAQPSRRLY